MKKLIALAVIIITALNLKAQKAEIVEDTLSYNSKSYHLGDTLQLMYGSKANKDFAFIYYGSGMNGVSDAPAGFSKTLACINKVYKFKGKCYVRAKSIDGGIQLGNKLFIDVEGAIDNKEIKEAEK